MRTTIPWLVANHHRVSDEGRSAVVAVWMSNADKLSTT